MDYECTLWKKKWSKQSDFVSWPKADQNHKCRNNLSYPRVTTSP